MSEWKVYRTRYLVRALRLSETTVVLNEIGQFQTGQPGDYLVQCSDGSQRISPRHVFEDVYVEMTPADLFETPAQALKIPVQPPNPAD